MHTHTASLLRRLAIIAVVAIMVASPWIPALDATANEQIDTGLKRALVTFASARALNGAISIAQGTEVALQPAGVGINLSVGQVLDPVNDLVEQFSDLMLVASVAFGVQKVLATIGAHWAISLALTLAALGWAGTRLLRRPAPRWLLQLLVVLVLARFAVPVATMGGDVLFQRFLSDDYRSSQQVIDATSDELEKLTPPSTAAPEKQGVFDRLSGWFESRADEWTRRFDALKQAVEQVTEHVVRLMVIFLLQTLIFPVLFLWLLYVLCRNLFLAPRRA